MTDWTAGDLGLTLPDAAPIDGPVRLGSERHKGLFCRMLLETFNPCKPAAA